VADSDEGNHQRSDPNPKHRTPRSLVEVLFIQYKTDCVKLEKEGLYDSRGEEEGHADDDKDSNNHPDRVYYFPRFVMKKKAHRFVRGIV